LTKPLVCNTITKIEKGFEMLQVERVAKFKEKRVDTGEDYVPTKEDLTFSAVDISEVEKSIIDDLVDDEAIQEYLEVVLEDTVNMPKELKERVITRTLTYIAKAKNIKPIKANLAKLQIELMAIYNANHRE
jgi:DNA-binding phage protein